SLICSHSHARTHSPIHFLDNFFAGIVRSAEGTAIQGFAPMGSISQAAGMSRNVKETWCCKSGTGRIPQTPGLPGAVIMATTAPATVTVPSAVANGQRRVGVLCLERGFISIATHWLLHGGAASTGGFIMTGRRTAFTLIELLVAIAIIAVLLGLLL